MTRQCWLKLLHSNSFLQCFGRTVDSKHPLNRDAHFTMFRFRRGLLLANLPCAQLTFELSTLAGRSKEYAPFRLMTQILFKCED